ncbi:MAG: efflux transporter outer membrane subunit [Planctomycetota bacterium]
MKYLNWMALVLLPACKVVGPDYQAPEPELPVAFLADPTSLPSDRSGLEPSVDLAQWWRVFGDELLDELVERAQRDNMDLRMALARISEAESRLGVTRALRRPRLEGNAHYQRSGISKNTEFGLFPGQPRETDEYVAALSASWELDLWGQAKRRIEADAAGLEARGDDLWAVQVSLTGQVADAYLRLREVQARRVLAREQVAVLEQSVQTAQARFEAGLVQELDVLRARTEWRGAQAALPELDRLEINLISEIEVLLQAQPGTLEARLQVADGAEVVLPEPQAGLDAVVPADLLRRRPDIRSAERALAAQTALVGVAEADLYPSLSLTGNLGLLSAKPENLFEGGSLFHSVGPQLTMPLFSGGALRDQVAVEEARVEAAWAQYEGLVNRALHEVVNACRGTRLEWERLGALRQAVDQSGVSLERAQVLYREGLSTIDGVLDARRARNGLQDREVQARIAWARAHVDLYRALGGGWPVPGEEPKSSEPGE